MKVFFNLSFTSADILMSFVFLEISFTFNITSNVIRGWDDRSPPLNKFLV